MILLEFWTEAIPRWTPYVIFLVYGTLPDIPSEVAALKNRALSFEMYKGELFRKGYLQPLLKCVTPERGKEVLEDLHAGFCASHIGGKTLEKMVRRQGYFWPTLEADAMEMV